MKNIIDFTTAALFACQAVFLLQITLSFGLKCLSCQSADMKTCFKTTTTCRNNEECYLDKIVDSHFNTSFNAGCREKNQCSHLFGRRELLASDSKRGLWTWKACSQCCSTVNRTLPCNAALCNQGCSSAKSDIVFLLDSSSSIGNNLFEHTLKTFAVDFINNPTMLVGPEYNQIGLVSFTGHRMKATALNRFHDKASMTDAVLNNLHFETGTTETHEALQLVHNVIFTPLFGDRHDAENVLVIITDGGSHFPPKTLQEAEKLKKAGVRIYVIGVGDYINPAHLMEINGVSSGILSTYGLNSYNPKAIQELLWKSICHHVSTRLGSSSGQQSTAKFSGISTQTGKVSTRPKPHSTPKPTIRISVPTAPPLSKSSSSVPSTTQQKLTMPKTKSTSTIKVVSGVPTIPVTVVQNTPKWVSLQVIKSTTPSPCVDNALCITSGVSLCSGVYANWARGSCPKLCGFCKATTPVTALTQKSTTSTPATKQTKPRSPATTISPTTTPPTTMSPTTTPPTTTSPTNTPPTTTLLTTTSPTTTLPTTTSPTTTPPTTTSPTTTPQTTTTPTTTSPTTTAPTTTLPTTTSPSTTPPTTTSTTTTQPTTTLQTTTSPTTMPPTTTSPTTKYVCRNQVNCIAFGPTICGRNVSWAKTNCGAYCGYCSPPITTGPSQTSATTLGSTTTSGPTTKPSTSAATTSKPTTTSAATSTKPTTTSATTTTKPTTTSATTTTKPTTTSATTITKPTTTSTVATTKPTTSAATTTKPTTTSATTNTKPTTTSATTTTKPTTTSTVATTKPTTSAATNTKPTTTSATTTTKPTTTSSATTTKPTTTSSATTKKPTTMLSFAWKTIVIPG